jgi:hypothetical protein
MVWSWSFMAMISSRRCVSAVSSKRWSVELPVFRSLFSRSSRDWKIWNRRACLSACTRVSLYPVKKEDPGCP